MPGFYNAQQVAYFKQMEAEENKRRERKQAKLEQIRVKAYEKKHVDIGVAKPLFGKPFKEDPNVKHGVPTVKTDGVKEIFESWAKQKFEPTIDPR